MKFLHISLIQNVIFSVCIFCSFVSFFIFAQKTFFVEKEVVVVHRGSYNNNKCIIVCLTM